VRDQLRVALVEVGHGQMAHLAQRIGFLVA
jgi:hypothetical protein